MIATCSLRPILKIGNYHVTHYNEEWLSDAFDRAADAAGWDVAPFKADLLAGVTEYLEKVCPLEVLPIETLFSKIRRMLYNIGLAHLAQKLETIPPPILVDLKEMAGNCPIPLFFFDTLKKELEDLRHSGVEYCAFSGIKECVMMLENAHRWTAHCARLEDDLIHLINRTMAKSSYCAA